MNIWLISMYILHYPNEYIDGSVQDCSNSSTSAMELLQSWMKPTIYLHIINKYRFLIPWHWCDKYTWHTSSTRQTAPLVTTVSADDLATQDAMASADLVLTYSTHNIMGLLLLTWTDFNPSMGKSLHPFKRMGWNYLSISKLQQLQHEV